MEFFNFRKSGGGPAVDLDDEVDVAMVVAELKESAVVRVPMVATVFWRYRNGRRSSGASISANSKPERRRGVRGSGGRCRKRWEYNLESVEIKSAVEPSLRHRRRRTP